MHKREITLAVNPEIDKSINVAGITLNTKLPYTATTRLQNNMISARDSMAAVRAAALAKW